MEQFNFKSAICTSAEQSRKLLSLGLKKETADMVYRSYGYIIDENGNKERKFRLPTIRDPKDYEGKYDIPAWLVFVAAVASSTRSVKTALVYWLETIAFGATFTSAIMYSL